MEIISPKPLEKSKLAGDKVKSIFVKRLKGIPNYSTPIWTPRLDIKQTTK